MPTLILSNPLGADDAQRIGLNIRPYAVGEQIVVNDFTFATLIRTGYGVPYGAFEDVLLIGDGSPTGDTGVDGQWYLDKLNEVLWGPKTGGVWPSDPVRPDRGIAHLSVDSDYHLIVTYSTGTVVDLGNIRGAQGPDPDPATAAAAGIVRLPGDTPGGLGGTADQPTVVGWGDKANVADVVPLTQRGAPGGVATLDGGGLIPSAQLPPLAITNTFPVDNQAEMLALAAQVGDVAIRADGAGTFILRAEPASTLANWSALAPPAAGVTSVDGRTGVVSLTDLYLPQAAKGAAGGVASLGTDGKVPAAQLPASSGTGGGGDGGFVLATPTADPNVPLDLSIVSNWGITDAGATYYDDQGAPAAEAGLLIPDPDTGSVAVWRPGAPYTNALDTRLGQLGYGRDRGAGVVLPTTELRRGDTFWHDGLVSLMRWNGTAWRQTGTAEVANDAAVRAISATHAAALHRGFRVRDLAADREWEWTGTFWRVLFGAPAVNAFSTAAVSVANNAWTLIPMTASRNDDWGAVNLTSGIFTCPVAGVYRYSSSVGWNAATGAGDRAVSIYWRDTVADVFASIARSWGKVAAIASATASVTAPVVIGEYPAGAQFAVYGLQTSGAALIAAQQVASTLTVELIEQTG